VGVCFAMPSAPSLFIILIGEEKENTSPPGFFEFFPCQENAQDFFIQDSSIPRLATVFASFCIDIRFPFAYPPFPVEPAFLGSVGQQSRSVPLRRVTPLIQSVFVTPSSLALGAWRFPPPGDSALPVPPPVPRVPRWEPLFSVGVDPSSTG